MSCSSKGIRFSSYFSHIHKSDLLELEVKTGVGNVVKRARVQVKPNKLVRNGVLVANYSAMGTRWDLFTVREKKRRLVWGGEVRIKGTRGHRESPRQK